MPEIGGYKAFGSVHRPAKPEWGEFPIPPTLRNLDNDPQQLIQTYMHHLGMIDSSELKGEASKRLELPMSWRRQQLDNIRDLTQCIDIKES